jgi:large repetitive protein
VYRLQVTAPQGYTFPSRQPPALQPSSRVINATGSYGNNFPVDLQTGAVELDVPLDAVAASNLFVEKTAARNTVELGDFVDYSVRVRNAADELLGRVRVTDHLPAGFAYVPASARLNGSTTRLNGSTLPEPEGGVGPVLHFEIGSLPDRTTHTLTYRVRVGPGALQGDGVNRAQASTPAPLPKLSNEARAAVQVLPGVFTDRGFVLGRVSAECPQDEQKGERTSETLGVPGVRLYLQDGTHVVTDRQGRYSLYGLAARTHVLKLDATTLAGMRSKLIEQRQGGDAASRFVDLKNGELHRADFVLEGCNPAVREQIKQRAQAADAEHSESEQMLASRFSTEPSAPADPRSLPASGAVAITGATLPRGSAHKPTSAESAVSSQPALLDPKLDPMSDEQIAAVPDNHLEIMNLRAGTTLVMAQANVIVKGRLGTRFVLSVNGVELGERRVGKRSTVANKKLQVWEFIGVDFVPGRNELELTQHSEGGRIGEAHMIVVHAPGPVSTLRMTPSTPKPSADGKTAVVITLETLDALGHTNVARTPVTLDTSFGPTLTGASSARWNVRDLNPDEAGIQIFVEGGKAQLELLPPGEPGTVVLRASAGAVQGELPLAFAPDLRPMVAVGLIEGVLDLRRLKPDALQPARAHDGFEQALRNLSRDFGDGKGSGRGQASARAALFLKGRIKGDMLLTLGYDSEKTQRERLFRDIQPDAYYAVYGDSATRGFDAQSTGKLYARVDHNRFYALVGDFNTQQVRSGADDMKGLGEHRLGQVARSLNGVKGQLKSEDGRGEVGAFASRSVSRQVVQELPALGISGPYLLERTPLIENSEKVEIITRDRDLPSRTVRSVVLTRFADYDLEPMTGRLMFRAPVPSLDADFHPNSIRVSYEVEQGGQAYWVGGAQARHQIDNHVAVSGTVVRDNNPQAPSQLAAAMATVKIGDNNVAVAEVARMDKSASADRADLVAAQGNAVRVELRHDSALVQAQAQLHRVERGFDNPAAGLSAGQQEAAARLSVRVDPETVLKGEVLHSQALDGDARRKGFQVGVERNLTPQVRGELSVRRSEVVAGTAGAVADESSSVRVKLLAQLPQAQSSQQASVFVEAEQDVHDSERRLLALGGEMRLHNGVRLYGRHELVSSLGPRYGLNEQQQRNASVLGISGEPFAEGQAFGEYRLRNALSAREAEAAMGLRQRFTLGQGLTASAGIERVRALSGAGDNDSTALTSSLDYNDGADWRANGRLELRFSPQSDGLLSTVGAAWRIDTPWTLLARNALSLTRNSDGSQQSDDWLQVGLAYRDAEQHRTQALMRAEWRGARKQSGDGSRSERDAFILSAHAHHQWQPGITLSGRYAAKWVRDHGLGLASRDRTQLLFARATRDIGERWDVSVHSALLFNSHGSRQFGLGAELGYLMSTNLWLSAGYNLFGLRERELAGQDHTQPGVYLRLRFKFDESSF